MARKKKKAEQEGISAGWINTFADLMNLLLCFFVLLFSMSTVDADKYEQLVTSMTERINIFDGGGAAVGEVHLYQVEPINSFRFRSILTNMKIPERTIRNRKNRLTSRMVTNLSRATSQPEKSR